jgi:CRP/FNR family cyclic AMP-dependent transcriptional regulator
MNPEVTRKIEQYFSQYPLRSYHKDQILIHAGDESPHIFYLISGKVSQYDISYRGDEVAVNIFKAGAFFPMLGAITKKPNRYFFGTVTPVELRIAPQEEVLAFLKNNPDVVYDLLSRLYVGVDGLLGRMAHLMAGTAKSRLLYELIIECRRFGEKRQDDSCLVAIKEVELAKRAGLSRETVSRELQKIIHDDLIQVSRQAIVVKNLSALEARLGIEL